MNNWREFRFVRDGQADLVWMIKQDAESYFTRHGQLNGKFQEYSDTPGDKGKLGTKAYVDPVSNCTEHVVREIRKKTENGYVEYVDGVATKKQASNVDFSNSLPKSFCSFKPQTDIKKNALEKLHKRGLARYSRKRDGMCHIAVHHTTGWELYTRRMDLTSDRFPYHIISLSGLDFEEGTILVGEMLCEHWHEPGKDDFKSISSLCRSLPDEAVKKVKDGDVPKPKFVVFDILFHNGKDLKNCTYDERAEIFQEKIEEAQTKGGMDLIEAVEYYNVTPDTWEDVAKDNGWEGFVVVDGSSVPGDKFYSFNGKPHRPKGHHKLKPIFEEDAVIYAALKGTGKRLGGIGSVFVKQRHPDTGEWVALGKVGSGFTDESLEEINRLCEDNNIPVVGKEKELADIDLNRESDLLVCEIKYSDRQPGTNKFRFPVFVRFRHDKGVDECVAQRWNDE